MTAEERIKKWKAEGEYAKALVVMSSLYRRKRTKKEICKPYGLTEKDLETKCLKRHRYLAYLNKIQNIQPK